MYVFRQENENILTFSIISKHWNTITDWKSTTWCLPHIFAYILSSAITSPKGPFQYSPWNLAKTPMHKAFHTFLITKLFCRCLGNNPAEPLSQISKYNSNSIFFVADFISGYIKIHLHFLSFLNTDAVDSCNTSSRKIRIHLSCIRLTLSS